MRVLIAYGSKRGGTEGIACMIGGALEQRGFDVAVASAEKVRTLRGFDAVIVGGALYANRWVPSVRRFVRRHLPQLRKIPVWFFSSGPLDDSGAKQPPAPEVAVLAERVGAKGHRTFGGRLDALAQGFPASAMAKTNAGDWRDPAQIHAWAEAIADELPLAKPGKAIDHPAASFLRLGAHALVGWAVFAGLMAIGASLLVRAIAAPVIFALIGWSYFRAHGARSPAAAARGFTEIVVLLELGLAYLLRDTEMLTSIPGTWLPFVLIFLATWAVGTVMLMIPTPDQRRLMPPPRPRHA